VDKAARDEAQEVTAMTHAGNRAAPWWAGAGRMSAALLLAALLLAPLAAQAQLQLVNPAPGETVHSNAGTVPVAVAGAAPKMRFQALLDGAPIGPPSNSASFVVNGVPRGTHRLAVAALDADGAEVARTEEVEFHVWQASRLFPNRSGGQ
jgi:hypothetical protein